MKHHQLVVTRSQGLALGLGLGLALALTSPLLLANQQGDILLRVGATMVDPDSESFTVYAGGNTIDLGAGPLLASVDDDITLGINLVYFLTDRWAVELLAATPFEHELELHSGDTTLPLGETKHLPPTLMALYYFTDPGSPWQPYAGAGINYTVFFEDNFVASQTGPGSPLNLTDLQLENSWGISAQIGFDYHFSDRWFANASARYIDIGTDAKFKAIDGTVPGKVSVDIDPMVYTLSLGYKF